MKIKNELPFRYVYLVWGALIVIALRFLTDPSSGLIKDVPFAAQWTFLFYLANIVLYMGAYHVSYKGLFDYVNFSQMHAKAQEHPTSFMGLLIMYGLFGIALAIVLLAAVISVF